MSLIRISESDDWFVDYDIERGMYRLSAFESDVDYIKNEYWFDAYEEKEVTNKTELIGYLETLKENSKKHINLTGDQFREILDRIIKYVNT